MTTFANLSASCGIKPEINMAGTGAARRYRSADAAVNRTVHLFSIIVYETLGAELIGYAREHLAYFEAQRRVREANHGHSRIMTASLGAVALPKRCSPRVANLRPVSAPRGGPRCSHRGATDRFGRPSTGVFARLVELLNAIPDRH